MAWTIIFVAIFTVGGILISKYDKPRAASEPEGRFWRCGVIYVGSLVYMTPGPIEFHLNEVTSQADRRLSLTCQFEVYNYSNAKVEWILKRNGHEILKYKDNIKTLAINITTKMTSLVSTYETHVTSDLIDVQNGTYMCRVLEVGMVGARYLSGETDVIIRAPPNVNIEFAKAISSSEIYLNWTLTAYNSNIQGLYLGVSENNGNSTRTFSIDRTMKYFIVSNLTSNTSYNLVLLLETKNHMNSNDYSTSSVTKTTLSKGSILPPPTILVRSFNPTSVGIQLSEPTSDMAGYTQFYELQLRKEDTSDYTSAAHVRHDNNEPYVFDNLIPENAYVIRARICFEYGVMRCSNWSKEIKAETSLNNPKPGMPENVNIDCDKRSRQRRGYIMNLTWEPPKNSAEINDYIVEMRAKGSTSTQAASVNNQTFTISFSVSPNTEYEVRLKAVSASFRRGREVVVQCKTGAPPLRMWVNK